MKTMHDGRLRVFGQHEPKVIAQAERCLNAEDGAVGSLSADGHFGYSAPVGLSIAYREHVSPAAVGYDIGCGNLAVATSLHADGEFGRALPGLMDRIYREVSFGMGRSNATPVDHPVLEEIARADYAPQRSLIGTARSQLGTVGAGNHYVDLFADETGRVWVGVHFGSRGFGHKTATMFLDIAARESGRAGYVEGKGEMEAPPDLLHVRSGAGETYMRAMALAGRYAHAGREVVVEQVLSILGAAARGEPVHNHHNFAWMEEHEFEDTHVRDTFYVIRKGATPAFPGQRGFVGASMGEPAVILEGVESELSAQGLYSTVHGAGRAMSRTAAAGKSRKRWSCLNRDCDWTQQPGEQAPVRTVERLDGKTKLKAGHGAACPKCGHANITKRWVHETRGAVDWPATLVDLEAKGIELRGANAEEAPGAYKRLAEVLSHHEGTVRVLHTLRPLGVAMAAGDERDDYKD